MKSGLFVNSVEKGRLMAFVREEGSGEIEFESFSDLVIELDLSTKDVGGSPGLGEGETILGVNVLRLDISIDV